MLRRPALRLAWTLLAGAFGAAELAAAPPLRQFVHRAWGPEEGLPHGTVRSLAQSADGQLWVGTQSGLARFDGTSFAVFDHRNVPMLENDQIEAFAAAPDGVLWIGTYGGGLLRYADGHFRRFGRADGLPGAEVTSLALDARGHLVVGTFGGAVARFADGAFAPLIPPGRLPDPTVSGLVFDAAGDLWVTTPAGVARWRQGELRLFGVADGLPAARLRATAARVDGRLWVASDAGLSSFDGERFTDPFAGRGPTQLSSLQVDGDHLWLGSSQGIHRYSPATGRLENFAAPHPAAAVFALELLLDREGSLWVGSMGGGLRQLRPTSLRTFGRLEGLSSDFVTSVIEEESGSLLVTTRNAGLNRVYPDRDDAAASRIENLSAGLPDLDLWSSCLLGGELWLGSSGRGLLRGRPGGTWRSYGAADGIGRGAVYTVYATRDGAVWAGTNGGLARLEPAADGGARIRHFTATDGLPSNEVRILFEDAAGTLWVGTIAGLARAEGSGRDRFVGVGQREGLSPRGVVAMWQDPKGAIWLATAGALVRVAGGKVDWLTARDGLYDDEISYVLGDGLGHLWLGTAKGLIRAPLAELEAALDRPPGSAPIPLHQWIFDRRDGLPGSIWNQGVALRSRAGKLYFGSRGGLIEVEPQKLRPRAAPATQLLPPKLAAEPWQWRRFWSFGQSRLEFAFAAAELQAPDAVGWRCRLQGFEEEWSAASPARPLVYQVPPGDYTFEVMAHDEEGRFAAPLATSIAVPQRWGARLLVTGAVLVLIVAGMALLHRLRLERHRQRQAELTRRIEQARADLKILRGMLPICSLCKKVRDDAGYWGDLESYVAARSAFELRRGLCPDCSAERVSPERAAPALAPGSAR